MKIKSLTRKKKSVGVNVQINEIKKKKEKLVAKNYQKNSYPYLTDFYGGFSSFPVAASRVSAALIG